MGYALPPPPPLNIHGAQAANNWKRFEQVRRDYVLAMELNKKSEKDSSCYTLAT